MLFTHTKRISKAGFVSFWRNGVVSVTSVLMMTVTLFVIGITIFLGALLNSSLEYIKDKVDVNIYFVTDAEEEDILVLQSAIDALPEVADTEYISRDQALENFRTRHEDDYVTIQALDELEENPLGASLSIKARETSQYEAIARFLEDNEALGESEGSIVDKVNFYQNEEAIKRLTGIINGVELISLVVTIFLVVVSVLITFNTIRLAIYTSREEIGVMRLVGAGNSYVRGPFLVEGFLYGISAALVTLIALYPATAWLGDATERFFGTMNIFDYYMNNFGWFALIIVVSGAALGVVASFLAVRRYLRK
jgi:cell division transport system permease protein